jgi:hypothetical protein
LRPEKHFYTAYAASNCGLVERFYVPGSGPAEPFCFRESPNWRKRVPIGVNEDADGNYDGDDDPARWIPQFFPQPVHRLVRRSRPLALLLIVPLQIVQIRFMSPLGPVAGDAKRNGVARA